MVVLKDMGTLWMGAGMNKWCKSSRTGDDKGNGRIGGLGGGCIRTLHSLYTVHDTTSSEDVIYLKITDRTSYGQLMFEI